MPLPNWDHQRAEIDQSREAFVNHLKAVIDYTVKEGQQRYTSHNRPATLEKWGKDLRDYLRLNEGETPNPAIVRLGDATLLTAITKLGNALDHSEPVFEGNGTELRLAYRASTIVGFLNHLLRPSHSTQHSLVHSSRILGRHAQILDVETRGQANEGGYWLD